MSNCRPANWVVLRMTNEDETFYKVLGGWGGGYLDGDSWRLNSGIVRVDEEANNWLFYGSSGSCYTCPKGEYGLRMNIAGIFKQLQDIGDVVFMDKDTDWTSINYDRVA